jgi:3-deoxy-D-manno-octulosonic-acid transferase
MGQLGYNLLTQAYFLGIKLTSLWNAKAKQWVQGRVGQWGWLEANIAKQRTDNQRLVWMHCASLGEFEQGRPLLEALRQLHPELKILLTFFSPSGYEIRKNYPVADWVTYLPADTAANARRFLGLVKPDLAIFVKYEFWYHYLSNLKQRGIPVLLVSAIFRPGQPFFKWYGRLHREMLGCFSTIFVQDEPSQQLLLKIENLTVQVAGDTRVDRVLAIAKNPIDLPLVKRFCGEAPMLVCGSTWPPDEAILNRVFEHEKFKDWKFILVPHDVQPAHLQAIEKNLYIPSVRYSQLSEANPPTARLLLVDNIGLLSSLYFFGKIAYIGGGFGQGIHNTLEPAAYGLPIVFGPKYGKFEEAKWLVKNGGAFVVKNNEELMNVLSELQSEEVRNLASKTALDFIEYRKGATEATILKIKSLLFAG